MAHRTKAAENQEIASKISGKFTHALTWREPFRAKWDRFYKMYRSHLEEANYPWQSTLWIPYSFSTIETLAPRMVSNKPQIDIMPREPGDVAYAKVMADLVDFQWDQMEMQVKLPDIVKSMLLYGTAIVKIGWLTEKETKEVEEDVDESFPELGKVKVKQEVTEYDGPTVELVDLYDFFVDPKAVDMDSARWVIHRTYKTLKDLKELQRQGVYKNINLIERKAKVVESDNQKSERYSTLGASIPTDNVNEENEKVELLEYWEDNKVITLANRKVVIRDDKNPFKHGKKPFVRIVDQSVPHEFYGIGELEPIESLQYELNNRRNQRMDNVTLALNRMWKIKNGANVDEDELVSDAGGVIHTDDMNGVEEVLMPDVTSSSYQEETIIKGDIQQTTGVSDFTRGVGSDSLGNDTATGISLIQEAGSSRFRLKIQNLEEMGIKKIGQMLVSMNEQFIDEEKVIRIVGNEGIRFMSLRPEDLKGNFDVVVQAGSTMIVNEAVRRKQVMEMYQVFSQDPEINQVELKRMVLEAFGEKNIEKLLPITQPENIETKPDLANLLPSEGQLNQEGVLASTYDVEQPGV